MKRRVITIDGPSGTGKSTAARHLARRIGYLYLDTGAMYRAVALLARREGIGWDNAPALAKLARRARITFRQHRGGNGRMRVLLNGRDVTAAIRRSEISGGASQVAAVPEVRRALVRQQRAIGRGGGIVAEGRDTGTVVFPTAEIKFFLTADVVERARRRHRELKEAGQPSAFSEVLRGVRERDRRDRRRSASPLRVAPGAIRVVNTQLKSAEVLAILYDYVRRRFPNRNIRGRTL